MAGFSVAVNSNQLSPGPLRSIGRGLPQAFQLMFNGPLNSSSSKIAGVADGRVPVTGTAGVNAIVGEISSAAVRVVVGVAVAAGTTATVKVGVGGFSVEITTSVADAVSASSNVWLGTGAAGLALAAANQPKGSFKKTYAPLPPNPQITNSANTISGHMNLRPEPTSLCVGAATLDMELPAGGLPAGAAMGVG